MVYPPLKILDNFDHCYFPKLAQPKVEQKWAINEF